MSYYDKSYEERREERRREEDSYRGDVIYEVWRNGGNPDRVDYDRVSDHFRDDRSVESSAREFMPRPRQPEPEQYEEQQEECEHDHP